MMVAHVAGGGAALAAGAVALLARKGRGLHARAGTAFAATMLVMASTGAVLAAMKPSRLSVVAGTLTCYLVATAWSAVRHRDRRAGTLEIAALPVALLCVAAGVLFGLQATLDPTGRLDRMPPAPHFIFAGLAALAAGLDLRLILVGLDRNQRLKRHLWRMAAALSIAALSFFVGQQKHLPALLRGSPILFLPTLAVLGVMAFWLFRLRRPRAPAPSVAPGTGPGGVTPTATLAQENA